jgi:ribose transport system permease protein
MNVSGPQSQPPDAAGVAAPSDAHSGVPPEAGIVAPPAAGTAGVEARAQGAGAAGAGAAGAAAESGVAGAGTGAAGAAAPAHGTSLRRLIDRYALLLAWIATIALFGVLEPDTFLRAANFTSMFSSQAVLVVLTYALLVSLTAGEYDLSAAPVLTLSAMVLAILNAQMGVPIGVAILLALLAGGVAGVVNGILVVWVGIESIIVTLGTGTLVSGIVLWISNSEMVSGISQTLVNWVIVPRLWGVSFGFVYALGLTVALWYVLDYTPLGLRLLFVGRGRRVARLSGLNVARLRFGALVSCSLLAAFAGVLYAGTSGAADPNSGDSFMLPAFAAAFLGSTAVRPGRFNAWGSFTAVYFLVTGITGLSLMGIQIFIQDLFYGMALIVGVTLSLLVRRREQRERDVAETPED